MLDSFHDDPEAPPINYQLADLLREQQDFAGAAQEYEHTAYDYLPHEKAAAAGYAAIYAHREYLKVVSEDAKLAAKRDTVTSSLRFADTFPQHEHAAVVLGAAAEDLYEMEDFPLARSSAMQLIERFPKADPAVVRRAWLVTAHSSFDLAEYQQAEQAYARVLAATPEQDESHPALVENLAASIYKQGEHANEVGDYRAAADNFLRIKQVAPTSKIRAGAEYDAGAALIHLQDWNAAAKVLDDFRLANPGHELEKEATKQIAFVQREAGELSQSAAEYERVATESDDPALRAEALLLAGNLYEQSHSTDRALAVYSRYVEQFPKPVEAAVDTRAKIAEIFKAAGDTRALPRAARTNRSPRRECRRRTHRCNPQCRSAFGADIGRTVVRALCRDPLATAIRQELARQAPRDGCRDHGLQRSRLVRSRRSHGGSDLLSGRDLFEFQPLADRVRTPRRPRRGRNCRIMRTRSKRRRSRSKSAR